MIDILLAMVLALCLCALLWPFLGYPLVLALLPGKPVVRGGQRPPSASLLFAAYNESAAMPVKIANLAALKARHPDLEILAFDDGSSDDTAAQLAARPALLTLIRGAGRGGKAHGMKRMAAAAGGDVLIFTDANVTLAEDAVDHLMDYYADPQIGGVLGSLRYVGQSESATASVGSLYWRMEEALKDRESATGNVMGADGSIFSIRRALYPDFPDTVLDDLTASMAVVFAGKRLIKARDVLAYERLVAGRGDEYRRKVRIAARAWHTHRTLRPQLRRMAVLDRFKYGSRKVMRWFGGVFIIIGGLAAFALAGRLFGSLAVMAIVTATLLFVAVAISVRRGPVAAVADILIAYAATLQGVMRAMSGKTMAVWNPAASR